SVFDRILKGDIGSGNRSCPCSAVSLYDITVNPHGPLTEEIQGNHRPQRPSDQALYFLCPASNTSGRGLSGHANICRSGEHAVFGSDPPFFLVAEKGGDLLFNRRSANNFSIADLDKHRPLGSRNIIPRDFYFSQLAFGPSVRPHYSSNE